MMYLSRPRLLKELHHILQVTDGTLKTPKVLKKVWITGILKRFSPVYFQTLLLDTFGPLQCFYMPADPADPQRRHVGSALVQWKLRAHQRDAQEVLEGLSFRRETGSSESPPEPKLSVRVASEVLKGPPSPSRSLLERSLGHVSSRVLYVPVDKDRISGFEGHGDSLALALKEDETFNTLVQTLRSSCSPVSISIQEVKVPRPSEMKARNVFTSTLETGKGVGWGFIKFHNVRNAIIAQEVNPLLLFHVLEKTNLGWAFFFSEDKFDQDLLGLPAPFSVPVTEGATLDLPALDSAGGSGRLTQGHFSSPAPSSSSSSVGGSSQTAQGGAGQEGDKGLQGQARMRHVDPKRQRKPSTSPPPAKKPRRYHQAHGPKTRI
uniref:Uncharacterized protein n=1 Tax=Chromera velia CCMP2878 TaxID=1169474 RepID=A0A0G4G565_9ALVE|eukprot:Cvel_4191.t1-p1 / transcript=Cvel_4191.t1 / gene=Cvel_4191 / organism=Chromera_velia_CCMP2878 / gene_product=hypothetical protein / transcript_product=hypothetical protein / location=Cvel_scaffold181:844-3505(-) / protein_length=376 / sequence_SO=supercontig / SO=protein_coding / is_pseudo=false